MKFSNKIAVMKYISLVGILRTFKSKACCPECEGKYDLKSTEVTGIFEKNAFFAAVCNKCKKKSIVQIQVEAEGDDNSLINEKDLELLRGDLKNFGESINTFLK